MATDAAFLALRAELGRLRGSLRALRVEARRKCPDRKHCVPLRIYDSGPELRGLLRSAAAAAGFAVTAVEVGGGAVPRAMLTRCDQAVVKLRRRFRECVPGAARAADLKGLHRQPNLTADEKLAWKKWAKRVRPAVRAARRQMGVVSRALGACWRELAAVPPSGVTITNVAIGKQDVRARRSTARAPGSSRRHVGGEP